VPITGSRDKAISGSRHEGFNRRLGFQTTKWAGIRGGQGGVARVVTIIGGKTSKNHVSGGKTLEPDGRR